MSFSVRTPVILAQLLVSQILREGDVAVDATAGSGNDTCFLAERVGASGKVYAIDIQKEALEKTRERLCAEGLLQRAELILAGHEMLDKFVPQGIKAAMFNLGYLPGGDHAIVTRPSTTIEALKRTQSLLVSGGIITVVAYQGHVGGREEGEAVLNFAKQLNFKQWNIVWAQYPNRSMRAPFLVVFQKIEGS